MLLFPALVRAIGQPQKTLDLISPYFVPGAEGTAAVAALARSGVKVRILTNSLAATDVSAVHAGYSKRRRDLLLAGVALYELKPTAVEGIAEGRTQVRLELVLGACTRRPSPWIAAASSSARSTSTRARHG